jgi:hypothetical protein
MLILDAPSALPPGAPWWGAIVLAAGPGIAAIIIAWFQYRQKKPAMPELAPIVERVTAAEEKIVAIASVDRGDVAKLKDDLGALAADVEALRSAVERRWTADDKRRGRAGELAQADREKLHEAISGLREKVAGMAGTLSAMMERSNGNR